MTYLTTSPLRFGYFELDPHSGDLRRRGLSVRLTPQARMLLCLLLEPPIRTRTREEIQQRLWSSTTFVDFDRGMNKVVHSLREALGETARSPRFIETVSSEGYRFAPGFVEAAPAARVSHATNRIERVAVLPIAAEPHLSSVARGITTSIIESLALFPSIRVMAESTVKSHALEGLSPQQTGCALGVGAVLSGELSQKAEQLEVRMELIDAADGALLRGAHATRAAQPAMRRQEELAREIVDHIRERLEL